MYLRNISVSFLIMILLTSPSIAKIDSKSKADKFLNQYCIELVNTIEMIYKDQLKDASKNRWEEFLQKGSVLIAVADIYSKLCK